MKHTIKLVLCLVLLGNVFSCNEKRNNTQIENNNYTSEIKIENAETTPQDTLVERPSLKNISEVIDTTSNCIWTELQDSAMSLSLHFYFHEKDTLVVSYSSECYLMFPYKIDENKIVVYWDNNIDTKYDFDIVKAACKIDKKYIGKPFMILELINDTTLKATYPLKDLVNKINSSNKKRTFFPDKFNAYTWDNLYR